MVAPSPNSSSSVRYFSLDTSISNEINALIDGVKWGTGGVGTGATVYYSFPQSNINSIWGRLYTSDITSQIYDHFSPFTQAQTNAAKISLERWANVANLNLIEVTHETNRAVGDIRFANTSSLMASNYYAYAYMPAFNNPKGGDVWFNVTQPVASGNDYELGANGFHTVMHEIGHALGLEHPFEGDYSVSASLDHFKYTVMSYSYAPNKGDGGYSSFYPTTPMLLDIQAIQYLYGANMQYNVGDNVYIYNDETTYYETIWDAGGIDTIQYDGNNDAIINLNAGSFSSLGQPITFSNRTMQYDNVAIAYNVTIENAIGGNGNDIIYENGASNLIDGGAGYDTVVLGYASSDVLSVIQLTSGMYEVTLASETDYFINIEQFNFLDGVIHLQDLLTEETTQTNQSQSYNTTTNEKLSAIAGESIVSYTSSEVYYIYKNNSQSQITPTKYDGPVNYLTYQFIGDSEHEVAIGTDRNDFINLLAGDDAINGQAGDDVLDGGTGSNFLTGGEGNDIFFIDGRSLSTTWSTITDFNQEAVNIWGWVNGVSELLLTEESSGTEGYKGATLHYDLNGDQLIDTSVTFSGLSLNQITANIIEIDPNNSFVFIN
jgi:serralysin